MKKLLQNKKIWYAVGSVLVIALIFLISGTPAFVTTAAATKKLPIYCVQRDDKTVALSFDAAWGNAILRRRDFNGLRAGVWEKTDLSYSYTKKTGSR